MPPTTPRTSMRRLTPRNSPSACAARAGCDAHVLGGGDRRERVHDVVLAEQRPAHPRHRRALPQHGELAATPSSGDGAALQSASRARQAEGLARRPAARLQRGGELGIVAVLTMSRPAPGTVRSN